MENWQDLWKVNKPISWPNNSTSEMILKRSKCICLSNTCARLFIVTSCLQTNEKQSINIRMDKLYIYTKEYNTEKNELLLQSGNTWWISKTSGGMRWATHEENLLSGSIFMRLRIGKTNSKSDPNSSYLWRTVDWKEAMWTFWVAGYILYVGPHVDYIETCKNSFSCTLKISKLY